MRADSVNHLVWRAVTTCYSCGTCQSTKRTCWGDQKSLTSLVQEVELNVLRDVDDGKLVELEVEAHQCDINVVMSIRNNTEH
eukprot:5447489-Amphidinium_carterae.1